ncbi:hypothetical protein CCR75_008128 [Bremia lactucae]|uniref:Uncharacterized protein n=1 Tax=Bremia lactucae TaxID=4779 RepID=A0A976FMV4_BRELC|nr:hypothetical protein CCR75_008128 [Bremia lactucae]
MAKQDVLPRANVSARNDKVTRMNTTPIALIKSGDEERLFGLFKSKEEIAQASKSKIERKIVKLVERFDKKLEPTELPKLKYVMKKLKSVSSSTSKTSHEDLVSHLAGKLKAKLGLKKLYLYIQGGKGSTAARELEQGLYQSFGTLVVESSANAFSLGNKETTTLKELFENPLLEAFISYSRATVGKEFDLYVALSLILEYEDELAKMVNEIMVMKGSVYQPTAKILNDGLNYPIAEMFHFLHLDKAVENPFDDALLSSAIFYAEQYSKRHPKEQTFIQQMAIIYGKEKLHQNIQAALKKGPPTNGVVTKIQAMQNLQKTSTKAAKPIRTTNSMSPQSFEKPVDGASTNDHVASTTLKTADAHIASMRPKPASPLHTFFTRIRGWFSRIWAKLRGMLRTKTADNVVSDNHKLRRH